MPDTTALGAAYLAGLAEGVWDDLDEVAANWATDRRASAGRRPRAGADAGYRQWQRAVSGPGRWRPLDRPR